MTDQALVREYVAKGDQQAFAELVRRHAGWVHACARREVGDEHLAEDVTQAVFILVCQKARTLARRGQPAAWLFRVTRYCSANALRQRGRRRKHERKAAMRRDEQAAEQGANWEEIWPVLDEAVGRLRRTDREAVLLRFYRGMSLGELAVAVGIGEEAAKKRVQRAVEKLRGMLEGQGVTAGATGLGVVMAERVTEAMDAGAVQRFIEAAKGGGAGAAGLIAKGAMKMIAWAKAKVAAVVVAVVAGVGVGWAGTGGGGATTRPVPAVATAASPAAFAPAANAQVSSVQVLLPDGSPAAGAEVYLPRAGDDSLMLQDPMAQLGQRPSSTQPTVKIVTGADGRFTLPAREQRPKLVVVHRQGVAEIVPEELQSDRVMLQAWGRVEGQLSPALRTGAGQKVRYFSNRSGFDGFQLVYSIRVPVDGGGRFVIDRVPPGPGVVGRVVPLTVERMDRDFDDHTVLVDIATGKAVTIGVGGTGPDISGQVEPPPGSAWRMADTYAYVQLWALPSGKRPEIPAKLREEVERLDRAQQKVAFSRWAKTPEGQACMADYQGYRQKTHVIYADGIRGDGVFDLVQVPPGKYRMRIDVMTLSRGPGWNSGKMLAWLLQEIVVPEGGAGTKVDMGRFVLKTQEKMGR